MSGCFFLKHGVDKHRVHL